MPCCYGLEFTIITKNQLQKEEEQFRSAATVPRFGGCISIIMAQEFNYSDLWFPIYLNQQVVFDLLAILEDGFSHLSSVKASSSGNESQKSNLGASLAGSFLILLGFH